MKFLIQINEISESVARTNENNVCESMKKMYAPRGSNLKNCLPVKLTVISQSETVFRGSDWHIGTVCIPGF